MEISRHQQSLVGVAYRITNDIETARDIVQETFASLLESNTAFGGFSSLKTYLYRIVINKSIDNKRRQFRWRGVLERIGKEATFHNQCHAEDDFERESLVRILLNKIPDMFRVPLLLADVDGMSYEEIADTLKISINTVRTRIYRCREKLRKEFKKAGYV